MFPDKQAHQMLDAIAKTIFDLQQVENNIYEFFDQEILKAID